MAQAAVGESDRHKPAVRIEALHQPRLHRLNVAAQKAGQIDQVATVGQHEIARFIGFGIACWPPHLPAGFHERLQVVGHGVTID